MGLRRSAKRIHREQRGAQLVEFAILAPLLILLVLGIIEFGWLFGQFNDVRHGAREGARFAAVNAGNNSDIHNQVCTAMDGLSGGMDALTVQILADGGTKGSNGQIQVVATIGSLSNAPIISQFLPDTLSSTVSFRLEQDSTQWGVDGGPASC